jgi:hypothetical protein
MRHANVIVTSSSSPSSLPLWLTPAPKRGHAAHGRRRDASHGPSLHLCRPCTPAMRLTYKRPPPQPPEDPNPSRLGESFTVRATRSPEEEKKGGEEEGRPGGQPQVHRRRCEDLEAARGTLGHREAVNLDAPVALLPLPVPPTSSSRVEPFYTTAFISWSRRS